MHQKARLELPQRAVAADSSPGKKAGEAAEGEGAGAGDGGSGDTDAGARN